MVLFDGVLDWDDDEFDFSIEFSVTPFDSLEQARAYVEKDYARVVNSLKRNRFDPDDFVTFRPHGWFLDDDFSREGRTAVPGEGRGFSVWYRLDLGEGEFSYGVTVDSVVEAPEGAESSFRVDRENECIEGSFVAEERVPDYGDPDDDWDADRDGFIARMREAVIVPYDGTDSSPGELIDWTKIGEYEVDGLKALASRGDLDAKYLLVQVAFDQSEDRPRGSWLPKNDYEYLADAFESGCKEAVLPYMKHFFQSELYYHDIRRVDGFIEFCKRVDKDYPEFVDDCVELLVDVSEDAVQELKDIDRRDWSESDVYRFIQDFAERLERLPKRMLGLVQKALPDDFKRIADKEGDPNLGGQSLESFLESDECCAIDYLYERYGLEAVERYAENREDVFEFEDEDKRERFAQLSPVLAAKVAFSVWGDAFGSSKYMPEDIFHYGALEKKMGTLPDQTFCYQAMQSSAEDGIFDEFMKWWQPSIFKKYGLEELTELGISILNESEFWYDLDEWTENNPSFLEELIPILREYDEKGSEEACDIMLHMIQESETNHDIDFLYERYGLRALRRWIHAEWDNWDEYVEDCEDSYPPEEGEFLRWWKPALFKQYGLEELTERGLSIFCDENHADIWDYQEEWTKGNPSLLDELIPILREYDAKGSEDARALLAMLEERGWIDPS